MDAETFGSTSSARLDPAEPESLRRLLREYGIEAKQGRGQHWLCNPALADDIVASALPARSFLEIGPGLGPITSRLVGLGPVVAVEVDPELAQVVRRTAPGAEVVVGDALEVDLRTLLAPLPLPRAVVSNLPYNLTTRLLERFCAVSDAFDFAVVMMQREAGNRLFANPGQSARGYLAALLDITFTVRGTTRVGRSNFVPQPTVDSVVYALAVDLPPTPDIQTLLKAAFLHPRRTLLSNLVTGGVPRADALDAVTETGLSPTARAHQVSRSDWLRLAGRLHTRMS